jgi:hypothetical protein
MLFLWNRLPIHGDRMEAPEEQEEQEKRLFLPEER